MKAQSQNPLFNIAEVKVSYQPKFRACERPKINSSEQAYEVLISNWNMDKLQFCEQCYMLLLNRANNVIGMTEISCGGFAGTILDPKVIFSIALKGCASGLILAHSHPSGNRKPSLSDMEVTRRLVEAGKLLDLQVVDHLIITNNGFCSFADEGLM